METYQILHDFYVSADENRVFNAFTQAEELDKWWTKSSEGEPALGQSYRFYFGEEFDWLASVHHVKSDSSIEYKMERCSEDWEETSFGIALEKKEGKTLVRFYHKGWKTNNHHFRRTSFCWANLLYQMKQWIENGSVIPFDCRDSSS